MNVSMKMPNNLKILLNAYICLVMILSPLSGYAQNFHVSNLPQPGTMVSSSGSFAPALVKGMVIHPEQPLNFEFIVDSGNDAVDPANIAQEGEKIAKYFLAALTVPENDLWVNLSPFESDRIIADGLGETVLGRDMLAQDYILKQFSASLMYPEKGLGKDFWEGVYKQVRERLGDVEIPMETFNKVWIMPQEAEVFVSGNKVFITKARLKVMLDTDYIASRGHSAPGGDVSSSNVEEITKDVMREIIIPAIEKEVNEGSNFAPMRQIYYAAILAKWYREMIRETVVGKAYVGQNKIDGVSSEQARLKEEIYARYVAAYQKGVFNYIREDNRIDGAAGKYFSGGEILSDIKLDQAMNLGNFQVTGELYQIDFAMQSGKVGKVQPVYPSKPLENDLQNRRDQEQDRTRTSQARPGVAGVLDKVTISSQGLELSRQIPQGVSQDADKAMMNTVISMISSPATLHVVGVIGAAVTAKTIYEAYRVWDRQLSRLILRDKLRLAGIISEEALKDWETKLLAKAIEFEKDRIPFQAVFYPEQNRVILRETVFNRPLISDQAQLGGVTIKDIAVSRQANGPRPQFNEAALLSEMGGDFNGFSPIILSIKQTQLSAILGIK